MSNVPAPPPLLNIIERLQANASNIHNDISKIEKRMEDATDAVVVICDLSSSMLNFVGSSRKTKLDMLKDALLDIMNNFPRVHAYAFNDVVWKIRRKEVQALNAYGSTQLAGALEYISTLRPRKTILISDGCPNSQPDAIREAEELTGTIDIIYCGPETDTKAIGFMESLCKLTGGKKVKWDMSLGAEIEGVNPIRLMLPPGA